MRRSIRRPWSRSAAAGRGHVEKRRGGSPRAVRRPFGLLPVLLCMAIGPVAANAADAETAARPASKASRSTSDVEPESRAAREEQVLAFLEEHNAELADVLASLKRRKSSEYDTALDELGETVADLVATRAKDPDLYELELRLWQTRSRVEMLVARLLAGAKKGRPELERKLREAVSAELEAKADHLAHRKQRSMAWYDRQIDRIRDRREEVVDERMRALLKHRTDRGATSGRKP